MSLNLKSKLLKRQLYRGLQGTTLGVIKRDTRNLDYGSYGVGGKV